MARRFDLFMLTVALGASCSYAHAQQSAPAESSPAESLPAAPHAESAPAAPPALLTGQTPEVVPGAFQEERGMLLRKILKAKEQGCGIGGYLSAFDGIQKSAASGTPDPQLKQRIDSISKALDEQIERSRTLKTQRASATSSSGAPMGASSMGGNGFGRRGGMGGGPGGGAGGGGLDDLMARFGNKLPSDVDKGALMKRLGGANGSKMSPEDLARQFKDDPRAAEVLEKLKGLTGK